MIPVYIDGRFEKFVFLEDIFVLCFGMFIGGFIMTLLICRIFAKTKSIESKNFDKISFVRFVSVDGKKTYFLNTANGNVFEIVRTVLLIIFSPSFLSKHYVVKSEKRAKILIKLLILCFIICSIFALISIFTIDYPSP